MRFAPGSLAIVAGDWLLEHSDEVWLHRYGHRIEERRFPQSQAARLTVAETIGQDGWRLLTDLFDEASPLASREKFPRSRSCVKSGYRTIAMMTVNCIGERSLTFLRQPNSSIRLTIKKPVMAKSTARAGPDTRCT